MKIVMFQYNREVLAIMSEHTLSRVKGKRQFINNSILASGYDDRLLREEVKLMPSHPKGNFIIPGIWQ